MQLKLSMAACSLLLSTMAYAEDYISIQYMSYDEDSGRTTINSPHVEINKDFGPDYTLNVRFTHDSVSGASPTYYDASSGASASIPSGISYRSDIKYGNISYEDERKSVAMSLVSRFESRDELTLGFSYSSEDDYVAREVSAQYLHYTDESKNSSITIGTSYQRNDVDIYCFLGTSSCDGISGASGKVVTEDIDVFNAEIGYTQVIDKTSLIKASVFTISEKGHLSNPYMRVVRDYNTAPKITQENKPNTRQAIGVTLEYSKAITDKLSTVLSYRFYHDDWDISSHTFDAHLYYSFSDSFTMGLNMRAYTQSEAYFFASSREYFTDEEYVSSDRRMSAFDSLGYGVSLDYKLTEHMKINLSAGYYEQYDYFDAAYVNVGFKYTF